MTFRHYKTRRGALRYCDLLRAAFPDKQFDIVPNMWGWAVALIEDGKVRALCA